MNNNNITQPIKDLENNFKKAIIGVPQIMANEALNFVADNFNKGGFQGSAFQKWRKRKDPNKWGAVERPGRAILVDKGRLRRAGRTQYINQQGAALEWPLPYAKVHNEGLQIGQIQKVKAFTRTRKGNKEQVKEHTRRVNQNIPKRQFVGVSPIMNQRINRHALAHILKYIR